MPEMDGYEFTLAIRRLPEPACRVPVICMSGGEISPYRVKSSGISGQLRKPFTLDDLNAKICEVTGKPVVSST
jgi:CheY-like chemotaxis protein